MMQITSTITMIRINSQIGKPLLPPLAPLPLPLPLLDVVFPEGTGACVVGSEPPDGDGVTADVEEGVGAGGTVVDNGEIEVGMSEHVTVSCQHVEGSCVGATLHVALGDLARMSVPLATDCACCCVGNVPFGQLLLLLLEEFAEEPFTPTHETVIAQQPVKSTG